MGRIGCEIPGRRAAASLFEQTPVVYAAEPAARLLHAMAALAPARLACGAVGVLLQAASATARQHRQNFQGGGAFHGAPRFRWACQPPMRRGRCRSRVDRGPFGGRPSKAISPFRAHSRIRHFKCSAAFVPQHGGDAGLRSAQGLKILHDQRCEAQAGFVELNSRAGTSGRATASIWRSPPDRCLQL